jgi:hypothetical protein
VKLLFSSKLEDVDIVKGMLAQEGIACEVTNAGNQYPGPGFDPKLWVINDTDFDRASAVLENFKKPPVAKLGPWTCPACGEQLEGQFSSCWKCGTLRKAP